MRILAGSLLLQLFLWALTGGSTPDLLSFAAVDAALRDDPLHVYSLVNHPDGAGGFAWPYPPGYLPVVVAVSEAAQVTGLSFARMIRIPEMLSVLAIAWLVQWELGQRGRSDRDRLIATALVAFSPAMLTLASMHGQIDPVQWLFAVAGIIAWMRVPGDRRALAAGLLIGTGIAIKTLPGLALLALLPLADSHRERLALVGATMIVPALALAPFLIADPDGALNWLDYAGIPGQGGLSMIVQPELAMVRYAGADFDGFTGLQDLLQDAAPVLVAAVTVITIWLLTRAKPQPEVGVALLILGLFVMGVNFFVPYITWLVPFVVLADWKRFYVVIHLLALVPLAVRYVPLVISHALGLSDGRFYDDWIIAGLYIPGAALLWLVFVLALGDGWRRLARRELRWRPLAAPERAR